MTREEIEACLARALATTDQWQDGAWSTYRGTREQWIADNEFRRHSRGDVVKLARFALSLLKDGGGA